MINMNQGGMRNMNNLYQRLKPEYKAKLDDQAIQYPNAIKAAVNELKQEQSVLDLRYGTAMSLQMYLKLKSADITEILNLFEP